MTSVVVIPDLLGTCPADLVQLDQLAQSTPEEARARANRIRAGLADYTRMRQDIADARARRDWLSLGHDTWYAYVEAEYGEPLRQLARDDRPTAHRDLWTQGMSTRQISSITGASRNTIAKDVAQCEPPATVTGADGKQYPSTRPSTTDATDSPAGRDRDPDPGVPSVATTDRPGTQVTPVGADGGGEVTRDAGLAAAPRTDDGKPERPCGAKQPHPAHEGDYRCPGVPTEQPSEPERPRPPAWDPEERRAHEAEVRRIRDIEAGRRQSQTIVTTVRAAVVTIVTASRYGETGLVSAGMIRELREAIDLLEKEVDGED